MQCNLTKATANQTHSAKKPLISLQKVVVFHGARREDEGNEIVSARARRYNHIVSAIPNIFLSIFIITSSEANDAQVK